MVTISRTVNVAVLATAIIVAGGTAKAQVALPAFSWDGFYAGGSLGFGSSNYDISATYTDPGAAPPAFASINLPDLGGQGPLFAAQVGYNFMVSPMMVAGVQLDGTITGISNDTSIVLGAPPVLGASYTLRPRTMITLAGRAGFLPSPDTLLYGLLGYTRGSFRGQLDVSAPPLGTVSQYDFSLNGATVGIGIETRVGRNATVGLEYRYTHFRRYSFYNGPAFTPTDNLEVGFNTDVQTIRASYNIHF